MSDKEMTICGFTIAPGEIGYSLGKETENETVITKCGVVSFADGAKHESGKEYSSCAERRELRQSRRRYMRRRMRKIETLNVLSSLGYCPEIPSETLQEWRHGKLYPDVLELKEWLATDFKNDINPYRDRYVCATSTLDMSKRENRFCFGRAMYHLCQRRGYLSNAKDERNNNMAGEVNKGIIALTREMEEAGCPTLGAYFYKQLKRGNSVRRCYTGREVHYVAEFNYICDKQNISDEERQKLYRAIFVHRPLKSQKKNVGRCVFEPSKFRCQRSHPLFEEYRMWEFINSIKVRQRGDGEFQPLSDDEVKRVLPLFYRSAESFKFKDIAKAVAGKNATYAYVGEYLDCDYEFNYKMDKSVPGNQTIYQIIAVLGKESGADWSNWRDILVSRYALAEGKTPDGIVTDVWQVMMFFSDPGMTRGWFEKNLGVKDEKDLKRVSSYDPDDQYASVSLCAVRKILPFMQQRFRYDEAVFLANLRNVLPKGASESMYKAACDGVSSILNDFAMFEQKQAKEKVISDFLRDLCPDVRLSKMYHPSKNGNFVPVSVNMDGKVLLGNVELSLKNPVAHRAEVQFRKLVNELSKDGLIDRNTTIRVMVSTEMHGMNERQGIAQWQKNRREKREKAIAGIREFFEDRDGSMKVSEDQITKWLLWEEQKHVCFYTGKEIGVGDFLGPNARFDIEHTVPVSRGGDDSLMNKTLCDSLYNRETKKNCLPCELGEEEYAGIMERISALGWFKEIDKLDSDYNKLKERAKKSVDGKERLLISASRIRQDLDYLTGKVLRFRMKKVPEGFAYRQDAVGKAVRNHIVSYLKTGYKYVFSESQEVVKAYRKIWGLPSKFEYESVAHRRNCIDAIVLSCLTPKAHNEWKRYWENHDAYSWKKRPSVAKPWNTFTEDVLNEQNSIAVPYEERDNFCRNRKHVVRDSRGKILRDEQGNKIYQNSECVGMSLHKDSIFACRKDRNGKLAFGIRKSIAGLTEPTAEKIIDPALRQAVLDTLAKDGPKGLEDFVFHGKKVRHVRIDAVPKAPIFLKKYRDRSDFEHKQHICVDNDSNYCIGLYEGGSVEIVSPYKALTRRRNGEPVVLSEYNGNSLRAMLKAGTMVLFYENDKKELLDASREELARRLYYLKSFSTSNGYPILLFKHTAEKRSDKFCETHMGYWKNNDSYRPIIKTMARKCNILIEGYDFIVNKQGDIFLR